MLIMSKVVVILAISTLCGYALGATLPSFVSPCKRDDPNLIDCATKEGRKDLPQILNGIPDLKLPNMKPLKIPEVKINVGVNLKIKLMDIEVYGMDENDLQKFELDLKNRKLNVEIGFTKWYILSQYEINGRILVLPITGTGQANITYVNPVFNFISDVELFTKNGKEYLKLKNPKLTYTSKREYYQFKNLFNGDPVLGDQMNKFLDENWQDVSKEVAPAVLEVMSSIVQVTANAFFGRIPLDDLLPM